MQENWKKLWNMQVTIIIIVIGAFGTVTKGLLKGLEDLEVGGRVETVQTTALLRTARILRRALDTWGTCCHSDSSEKSSANADVKSSNKWIIIIIISFLFCIAVIILSIEPKNTDYSCRTTTFGHIPLGKVTNPLILPAMGLNSTTTVLLGE